ncbi:hypothetical protein BH09ACT10_BH09ACT10_06520 [soil metagenome]
MSVISDLLGIDHFTTSRGSTVRLDFLKSVAIALGVPAATLVGMNKDDVLARAIEASTGKPMPISLLSAGSTVTNAALQAIVDGIVRNGVTSRSDLSNNDAVAVYFDPLDAHQVVPSFDPENVMDTRDRRLVETAVRQGQDGFRSEIMRAYDQKCAITSCDATQTLQAAHIYPYRGPATNHVTNGMLLRADVHVLFDAGAISIDERSMDVLVKPHLSVTTYGEELRGAKFRLPRYRADRPSVAAIRAHREWSGF